MSNFPTSARALIEAAGPDASGRLPDGCLQKARAIGIVPTVGERYPFKSGAKRDWGAGTGHGKVISGQSSLLMGRM